MLSPADNQLLTQTGPDTPMGRYFRRFWQPVALSRELPEPDCPPIRVRVMGESLLAFRDSTGAVGLIDPRCPHRGADLFYGRNEQASIRCVYHGWRFDRHGRALELPNVPADSHYHHTIRVAAWPVREAGDIVWAYLGPPEHEPPRLPQLDFTCLPPEHRFVTKKLQQCNWAQSIEGAIDTSHFSFLHMPAPSVPSHRNDDAPADEKRLRWIREDPLPQFSFVDHPVGFVVGGSRAADHDQRYWRIAQFALPSHSTTPSTLPGETAFGYTWVPIDDHQCWIYTYAWNPERPLTADERIKFSRGHGVIAEVDDRFVPIRRRENDYLIDCEAQRTTSFTGVRGVAEQDAMVHDSQGLVADRSRDHLSPTDAAIARFRRLMLSQARALAEAGQGPEAAQLPDAYRLRSGSWFASASVPFEQVMIERFGHQAGLVTTATACRPDSTQGDAP